MSYINNEYKLYFSWKAIKYLDDYTAIFNGAKFFGPAIKQASKLSDNDSINLDLSTQFIDTTGNWEIARLGWKKAISQDSQEVLLDGVSLSASLLTTVRLITDDDLFLIDTSRHNESEHMFNLVYRSYLLNRYSWEVYKTIRR